MLPIIDEDKVTLVYVELVSQDVFDQVTMQYRVFGYQHSEIPSQINRLHDTFPASEHLLIFGRAFDRCPLSLFRFVIELVVFISIHLVEFSLLRLTYVSRRRLVVLFKDGV